MVLTDAATEGREALIRLWTENLPVQGDVEAKLQWTYLDGPNGRGRLAFLLRDPDDAAVGCAGIQPPQELVYRAPGSCARRYSATSACRSRKHRSGLAALTLQRGVKRYVDAEYDLSYGFPNDERDRDPSAHRLSRARPDDALRAACCAPAAISRNGMATRGSPGLARCCRRSGEDRADHRAHGSRASSTARLCWLDDVDARFDRLWDEANPTYPMASHRSSPFLRWRFLCKPGERNSIACLVERGSETLRAYAVVHEGASDGAVLADLFGIDLDAIDALLGLVLPALYRRGYATVTFRYLGDPRLRTVLAAHRFSLRDADRAVIVHASPSWPLAQRAENPNAWYITDLDEDT